MIHIEEEITETFSELKEIQFGLLSKEQIMEQSVCEITTTKLTGKNSVYDERMGTMENGKKCPTCHEKEKKCAGHFGHINLNYHILHPLFLKLIIYLLNSICFVCYRLLVTKEQLIAHNYMKLSKKGRFCKILKMIERIDQCVYCSIQQPKYMFSSQDRYVYLIMKSEKTVSKIKMYESDILQMFEKMVKEDIELLGFDTNFFHPKNLVMEVLPVLSPIARPYVMTENATCDDDLTIQYLDIIKANQYLKNDKLPEMKRQKYIQTLQFKIKSLFDNSGDKQKVFNGRPLKGIKNRLTGKEGLIRNNLMGKRVEKSARTVIGPDPTLRVDEIAIPYEIADILCYPVIVNRYNQKELEMMIEKGQCKFILHDDHTRINVKYATTKQGTRLFYGDVLMRKNGKIEMVQTEKLFFSLNEGDRIYRFGEKLSFIQYPGKKKVQLKLGDVVERKLRDGDFLLLNRQPTLHKGSMIGFSVRLRPGKTIRMNLATTSTFNADFDGDEMNLHCPSSVETETELRLLSSVQNHLISSQSGKANICIVQDSILSCYLMTLFTQRHQLSKEQFFQVACVLFMDEENEEEEETRWQVYEKKKNFFLTKTSFSTYHGKLLFSLLLPPSFYYRHKNNACEKEPEVIIEQGVLLSGSITKANIGSTQSSIIVQLYHQYGEKICMKFINEVQFLAASYIQVVGFSVSIEDCIINKEDTIQEKITRSFLKAKQAEQSTIDPHLSEMCTCIALGGARDMGMAIAKNALSQNNSFLTTIRSGAKGDYFNISQIAGLLGQQMIGGKRVSPSLSNNSRTLHHYPISPNQYTDEMCYESRGFIRGCLLKGLSPTEFFFHSMAGREGITDTAMKSVVGDTLIVVMIEDKYYQFPIGNWVDWLFSSFPQYIEKQKNNETKKEIGIFDNDLETIYLSGIWIPTINDEGISSWGEISAITRHDPTEYLYEFITMSGRKVIVSEHKSLIIWEKKSKTWKETFSSHIQVGDFVPVLSSLPIPPRIMSGDDDKDNFPIPFPTSFHLDQQNGIFIGLLLNPYSTLSLLCKTFISSWCLEHCQMETISEEWNHFLFEWIGYHQNTKEDDSTRHLPPQIFSLPYPFITGLICGYFSGNPTLQIHPDYISLGETSESLHHQVSLLCSFLGIFVFHSLSREMNNTVTYYYVTISSDWKKMFLEQIPPLMIDKEYDNKKYSSTFNNNDNDKKEHIFLAHDSFGPEKLQNDVILDPITSITIFPSSSTKYSKLYDITVPSTLNFGLSNGLQIRDTSTSGYIQRRMIKMSEDIQIKYDYTVRNSQNHIIQFAYGNNYLNPVTTCTKNKEKVSCDIDSLVQQINHSFLSS